MSHETFLFGDHHPLSEAQHEIESSANAGTPANQWDRDATKRALDELFTLTKQYRSSSRYQDLLQFIARFRRYSAFNAMLVHVQMPGARYVLPPKRWFKEYERTIKEGAQPLVMLRPMGPVMFVFDVSDTEGKPLPPEVEDPFAARQGMIDHELNWTINNAKRDGVRVHTRKLGSQRGGSLSTVGSRLSSTVQFGDKDVRVRYEMELNEDASAETMYSTLAHELAHLYCGHLGTPNRKWWPNRMGLSHQVIEFEAESIAYLVCARLGIDNPSEQYLATYVEENEEVPTISLDCIMKAAWLIERMGKIEEMKPRKQ